jgi:hypothetical protein
MSPQSEPSFKTYRIESNVIGYPAFAICASYRAGVYLKAEGFVLVQISDSETTSMAQRISFSNNAGPDCPVVFDEAFALEDALRLAEVDFSIYMHNRNFASSAPLTWPKKQFIEIAAHRLVGVWAYSALNEQLSRVRDTTQCEPLKEYLHSFSSLPTIKLSPLAL